MRKKASLLFILLAGLWLSACTMTKPPDYDLPMAEGIYPGKEVTVREGENLYAFSQRFGVRLREVIVVNKMTPPYRVKSGQTLYLPTRDAYTAPTPRPAPLDYIDKGGLGPTKTEVKTEVLPPIPNKVVSEPTPLVSASSAPQKMSNLSSQNKPRSATEVKVLDVARIQESLAQEKEAPKPEAQVSPQPPEEKAEKKTISDLSGDVPVFAWPVRGTIISAFGPKGKGRDNDGLNIAAPQGAPVRAAAGGVVAYAGNDMKGFGNLVLIRHARGWVTAYAHLGRLVAVKDATVEEGDMIGTIGTTGGVSTPQLHFEIRREGKPVDPELVLR